VIVDLPTAAAAVAVQELAHARACIILNTSSINPVLTGRGCSSFARNGQTTPSRWATRGARSRGGRCEDLVPDRA